jgi:hypothetical protein
VPVIKPAQKTTARNSTDTTRAEAALKKINIKDLTL